MTQSKSITDELPSSFNYKKSENLIGSDGILKQSTKELVAGAPWSMLRATIKRSRTASLQPAGAGNKCFLRSSAFDSAYRTTG
ncbi:hypothetical protein D9M68_734340 [compost metagenome]